MRFWDPQWLHELKGHLFQIFNGKYCLREWDQRGQATHQNQIIEHNIDGGQINSKNCSEIETSYPAPPPIKKNERPRLIINLGMQKVRAQKRDFSILNHTGEKSKNECNMDSFEMEGKGNSTLNTAQKTTVI